MLQNDGARAVSAERRFTASAFPLHTVLRTCKQTGCMRTAHVHTVRTRIPWVAVGASESGSRHYRLLFDRARSSSRRDNFFPSPCPYVSSSPLSSYRLPIIARDSPSLFLLRSLSTSRGFLRTSPLHIYIHQTFLIPRGLCPCHSLRGNRLIIRLRRAKQWSKHRVLSPR